MASTTRYKSHRCAPGPAHPPSCIAAACAALLMASGALAQDAGTAPATPAGTLPPVVIGGSTPRAAVGGFGDVPVGELPMQVSVIGSGQMLDRNVTRIADVVALKASVSDAYNAGGYWDTLSLRGLAIDNRRNYLRDGLPINGETSLPLDNKERVEILEGLSGMQAGLSAPGGLVNLVVKRPTTPVRSALLGWQQSRSVLAAIDLGDRFGADQALGLRLNVAQEHLDPRLRDSKGQRSLVALAADWRVAPDTLLEAEVESSRRSQPSQPGFSLLGSTLPSAESIDPRINLNNQPWSQPVVMTGNTASLRVTQRVSSEWKAIAHYATQQLRTDDRLAYPFGCGAENNFDRYCSDGSFDYYAFHSDNERRRTDALDLQLEGTAVTGPVRHAMTMGLLVSRHTLRTQPRTDDFTPVGQGTVDGLTPIPAAALAGLGTLPNTDRTERSTELYLRDRLQLTVATQLWLGLRQTRLRQESIQTDGTEPIAYSQSFTTPWMALSHQVSTGHTVYGSWGEGIETAVTPNRAGYGTQAGQPLPALRSRQFEIGYKARPDARMGYGLAYFDIRQPRVNDTGATYAVDGQQRRRGIEADFSAEQGNWQVGASAMLLKAKGQGAAAPADNDLRPANVPERALKAQARYRVAQMPGLSLEAGLVHEGNRMVLPDDSVSIPAWTRLDLSAKVQQRVNGTQLTWRAGVDNATDKRAWRESPYQYGHAYLYPLAPRTWRLSLQADL